VLSQPAIFIKFETLRRKTAFLGVYLGYKAMGEPQSPISALMDKGICHHFSMFGDLTCTNPVLNFSDSNVTVCPGLVTQFTSPTSEQLFTDGSNFFHNGSFVANIWPENNTVDLDVHILFAESRNLTSDTSDEVVAIHSEWSGLNHFRHSDPPYAHGSILYIIEYMRWYLPLVVVYFYLLFRLIRFILSSAQRKIDNKRKEESDMEIVLFYLRIHSEKYDVVMRQLLSKRLPYPPTCITAREICDIIDDRAYFSMRLAELRPPPLEINSEPNWSSPDSGFDSVLPRSDSSETFILSYPSRQNRFDRESSLLVPQSESVNSTWIKNQREKRRLRKKRDKTPPIARPIPREVPPQIVPDITTIETQSGRGEAFRPPAPHPAFEGMDNPENDHIRHNLASFLGDYTELPWFRVMFPVICTITSYQSQLAEFFSVEVTGHFIEQAVLLVVNISQASTYHHAITIFVAFLHQYLSKSVAVSLKDMIMSMFQTGEIEVQAGWDTWASIRDGHTKLQSESLAPLYQNAKKVIALLAFSGVCTSASIPFGKESFDKFLENSKLKELDTVDLVCYTIDVIKFAIEQIRIMCQDGFQGCFFGDTRMIAFDKEYSFVVAAHSSLATGTLHQLDSSPADYVLRLTKVLDECLHYMSITKGAERSVFSSKHLRLTQLMADYQTSLDLVALRCKPYGVLLFGESGVGKSCLVPEISALFLQTHGYPSTGNVVCTLNPDDKYQSEYKPHHLVVVLDDIANVAPQFTQNSPLELARTILNNNVMTVLKADVDSKGKQKMDARLIIGTSNEKSLMAKLYSIEPASVLRRWDCIVTVTVRPEYLIPGTKMLDPAKIDTSIYQDKWLFDVESAHAVTRPGGKSVSYKPRLDEDGNSMMGISQSKLFEFIKWDSLQQRVRQEALVASNDDVYTHKLCPHGNLPKICSPCNVDIQPESFRTAISSVMPKIGFPEMAYYNEKWLRIYQYLSQVFVLDQILILCQGYLKDQVSKIWWNIVKLSIFAWSIVFLLVFYITRCYWIGVTVSSACAFFVFMFMCATHAHCIYVQGCDIALSVTRTANTFKLAALFGCFISILASIKVWYRWSGLATQSDRVEPMKPDAILKINRWPKAVRNIVEVGHQCATSTKNQVQAAIVNSIAHATFHLKDINSGKEFLEHCNIFPLRGHYWLCNWHVLQHDIIKISGIRLPTTTGPAKRSFSCEIVQKARIVSTSYDSNDLGVFMMYGAGTQADFTYLLPNSYPKGHKACRWIYRNSSGIIESQDINVTLEEVNDVKDIGKYWGAKFVSDKPTAKGQCMAPMMSLDTPHYLVAFHSAGDTGKYVGRGHCLLRSEIIATIESMPDSVLKFEAASKRELCTGPFSIVGDPHRKSPFNFMDVATFDSYGTHNGHRKFYKSLVSDRPISLHVADILDLKKMHGPNLTISSYEPWRTGLIDMGTPLFVPHALLELAMSDFLRKIDHILDKSPELFETVHPLTWTNSWAGADGCYGVDSMPLSTSAGWPYNKPKSAFIDRSNVPVDNVSEPFIVPDDIQKEVLEYEQSYQNGERCMFIARVSLKDEAVKLTSTKPARIIAGASMIQTVIMRKYYLPIFKFIMENAFDFECAVGINAAGSHWNKLVGVLDTFGKDRIIAGDYAKFDKTMVNTILFMCFKILIHVAERASYNETQLRIMRGIATDICEPVYEYNGEYIGAFCGNPSGHPGTVFINNLAGSLYMRVAYYEIYGKKPPGDFCDNIKLICYGDDNIMTVSDKASKFHHTNIQKALAPFGVRYTMADKEAESVPYINLEDATFLKRGFRFDDEVGAYMAPLAELSISKSLHVGIPSKELSPEEASVEVIFGALREWFQHGRDVFGVRRDQLNQVVVAANLQAWMPSPLPTYESYLDDYRTDRDELDSTWLDSKLN
jgi:hypothetical protein